jgi:hypothetical protein
MFVRVIGDYVWFTGSRVVSTGGASIFSGGQQPCTGVHKPFTGERVTNIKSRTVKTTQNTKSKATSIAKLLFLYNKKSSITPFRK